MATFSGAGGVVSLSGSTPQIQGLVFSNSTTAGMVTITSGLATDSLQMVNSAGGYATISAVGTQTITAVLELSSTVAATITGSCAAVRMPPASCFFRAWSPAPVG